MYNDTEPDTTYLSFDTAIYVQPIYTDTEPSTTYLAFGTETIIGKPTASDPFPADDATFGQNALTNFSVYVTDPEGQTMNVTFYDASTNTAWATVHNGTEIVAFGKTLWIVFISTQDSLTVALV